MPEEKTPLDHEHLPTKLGTEFVTKFSRLLKGATIYDQKNVNIDRLTHECVQAINGIIRSQGNFFLKIVRDNFFFNNTRIIVKADKYPIFKAFWQEMRKRWIGEVEFLEEVKGEHLKDFVYLLLGLEENNESNYLYVKKQLEYRNVQSIEVGKLEFFKDEEIYVDSEDQKKRSKEVYFKSISLVKEMVENINQQKALNIRKAKRLMQNAVNAILQDDSTLLGLANIKNYDEYTFNHSVNVAIYAIALGQRIGIPKKHLSHLGMAGLFHDMGKTRIPREILNKTGKLSPEEWSVMRTHPVAGTELIMSMKEWGELSTRMIEGAFEHHLRYDLTGYPRLTRKRKISLFGRIITVADCYDALVRPRVYNRFPYVSEKILGIMLERSGKDFDPAIVKVFINMIGIFPLGTLVLLNTNEMGIVTQIQEDTELIDRPKVCLLYYGNGEYRKGKVVDLKERDDASGNFKRSIVKTLDPNEYNLNVAEFLM
ncbi:MAG TPA: HD-GYP domain-containing protein [Thermodesulfobacteriota bacterium]|nr:HD-GYP domain-containing protein [Thermodesulfobacteriota bacterium]